MPTKKTTSKGRKPAKHPSKSKATEPRPSIGYREEGWDEAIKAVRQEQYRWGREEHYLCCKLFPWYGADVLKACPAESPTMPWEDNSEEMRQVRLHAMDEWQKLTGLPPLSPCEPHRWYAAAAAAGYVLPDVEAMPLDRLVEIVLTWALAKRANRQRAAMANGNEPPAAVYLGDGLLQIGAEPLRLHGQEELVIEALVDLHAASKKDLEDESGVADAVTVLRRIRKTHPILEAHIILPGKKNAGGYRTTISRPIPKV